MPTWGGVGSLAGGLKRTMDGTAGGDLSWKDDVNVGGVGGVGGVGQWVVKRRM